MMILDFLQVFLPQKKKINIVSLQFNSTPHTHSLPALPGREIVSRTVKVTAVTEDTQYGKGPKECPVERLSGQEGLTEEVFKLNLSRKWVCDRPGPTTEIEGNQSP